MLKKWLGMFALLVFLTISLAPSMNAQATWSSTDEFRTEYMRLLDTLSQRVPSSDDSTWAVELRRKISDIRQQVNGLSYPAMDRFSKMTDHQAFTKMVDALAAGDSLTKNEQFTTKAGLPGAGQPRQAVIVSPNFSAAVAGTTCSTSYTSAGTIDGEKIGLYVDRGVALLADVVCHAAPDILGEGTNTIPCGLWGIAQAVEVVLDSLIDHQEFCNALLDGAKVDGILDDVINVHGDVGSLDTHLTNVNNQITNEFTATNTHLTAVNTEIDTRIANLDTHLTNVDNHIALEFVALDTHLVALVAQLTTQISQATALLTADLKQVMKLELTPNGLRQIVPAILTCTGANCPNVLALCPAAGCSWKDVGPLP